ncbi:MAG: chromate transporter [Bacteroidaceae bacterium]
MRVTLNHRNDMSGVVLFLLLFYTFFKIGLFGFGGGYAMLSMIQGEVVTKYQWLTTSQFTDIVAISQMTPGPIGINSATYVGYSAVVNAGYSPAMGVLGSAMATFAVVLPSFILMFTITRILIKYRETDLVDTMFSLLRPTVVGLIAAAALILMTPENFSAPDINPWQFYISIFLFVAAFVGTQFFKINPIKMIIVCATAGFILFY